MLVSSRSSSQNYRPGLTFPPELLKKVHGFSVPLKFLFSDNQNRKKILIDRSECWPNMAERRYLLETPEVHHLESEASICSYAGQGVTVIRLLAVGP